MTEKQYKEFFQKVKGKKISFFGWDPLIYFVPTRRSASVMFGTFHKPSTNVVNTYFSIGNGFNSWYFYKQTTSTSKLPPVPTPKQVGTGKSKPSPFGQGVVLGKEQGVVLGKEHGVIPTKTKSGCSHSWKEYVGFSDAFTYCEKCDERK